MKKKSKNSGDVMDKSSFQCVSRALGTFAFLAAIGSNAVAAPIELAPGSINMFRDSRGGNDVGIAQGDRFQYGANVLGGSAGVTLGAFYPPTGFIDPQGACASLAVNANFCSNSVAFNVAQLQPWTLRFQRTLTMESLEVSGPPLAGTESPVPFPVNVTISGSGVSPTIAWTVPNTFVPNGFRINIYDKSVILANGQADIIHSIDVSPQSTSYQIPTSLSSGQTLELGGNYTINLQLIDTRNDQDFGGNNAQILKRSSSFFAFSPLDNNAPPNVALPTVIDGVYYFNITDVGPNSVTFIDPFVAIGYDYAIGNGDPNFASVLLPDVGDGIFDLEYLVGANWLSTMLEDGFQFFFPMGGVSQFRVRGIETAAGLDPNDVTAFITGLTFVTAGAFTGTMTPISVFVPEGSVSEPETILLLLASLVGLAVTQRRRNASPRTVR